MSLHSRAAPVSTSFNQKPLSLEHGDFTQWHGHGEKHHQNFQLRSEGVQPSAPTKRLERVTKPWTAGDTSQLGVVADEFVYVAVAKFGLFLIFFCSLFRGS